MEIGDPDGGIFNRLSSFKEGLNRKSLQRAVRTLTEVVSRVAPDEHGIEKVIAIDGSREDKAPSSRGFKEVVVSRNDDDGFTIKITERGRDFLTHSSRSPIQSGGPLGALDSWSGTDRVSSFNVGFNLETQTRINLVDGKPTILVAKRKLEHVGGIKLWEDLEYVEEANPDQKMTEVGDMIRTIKEVSSMIKNNPVVTE